MTEQAGKRPVRGYVASRLDEITLALLAVLFIVLVGAVLTLGRDEALSRFGCGLNDAVNRLLASPRACR